MSKRKWYVPRKMDKQNDKREISDITKSCIKNLREVFRDFSPEERLELMNFNN